MKRFLIIFLSICLLACLIPGHALASDESRSYAFELTADGMTELFAEKGRIITVTLTLARQDSAEKAMMHAMQAELLYDDSFFELVEGSVMTAPGIEWTDMARRTGGRAFYLNFVSFSCGTEWESRTQLGAFQLRIKADGGASAIKNENFSVSLPDGSGSYPSTANDINVIVSSACTVTFETGGGRPIPPETVQYGEYISLSEAPLREGYDFIGWYSDLDRTKLFDPKTDPVKGNLTLYAAWQKAEEKESAASTTDAAAIPLRLLPLAAIPCLLLFLLLVCGKKTVRFDCLGGSPVLPVKVKKGSKILRPADPAKPGAAFSGWYRDKQYTVPFDFEHTTVKKNMTLYARWK